MSKPSSCERKKNCSTTRQRFSIESQFTLHSIIAAHAMRFRFPSIPRLSIFDVTFLIVQCFPFCLQKYFPINLKRLIFSALSKSVLAACQTFFKGPVKHFSSSQPRLTHNEICHPIKIEKRQSAAIFTTLICMFRD